MIWLFGKLMQKIFFGDLRAAEIEVLSFLVNILSMVRTFKV